MKINKKKDVAITKWLNVNIFKIYFNISKIVKFKIVINSVVI